MTGPAPEVAPDPVVIDSPEALRRVMRTDYTVSEQQWQAISAPLEPAVVIAGAGSGKTSLMAARVVYLVATGAVQPDQVLGLTFTTKAASELRIRINEALALARGDQPARGGVPLPIEEELLEPTVATYNAYAASLLDEHGLRVGHEPDTRVLADASRYQVASRVVARHTGTVEQLSDHPETVIQYLLVLDGAMSEHLVAPATVLDFDAGERAGFLRAREEELAGKARKTYVEAIDKALSAIDRRAELMALVEGYRRMKADTGLMDFSDQIALGARLAGEHPEVGRIEREKFRIVLLDEYQDTSVAQALMLTSLFSGQGATNGRGHAVTAVGDPNQAIYGWRGASVSNILNFGRDFPAQSGPEGVPTYPLTVNRRSDEMILDVANGVARELYEKFDQVQPLEPAPSVAEGEVRVSVHEHRDAELAWLAGEVTGAHERAGRWADIGVLVRDNGHAAEVFDALTGAEIPVEIVGLSGLLRLPEVNEVVATLRLVHDLTANADLLTLLTGPRWAIGPRDLALLGKRAAELAGQSAPRSGPQDLESGLNEAVAGSDPTEIAALCDALEDPGEAAYSGEALERFALLAAELRWLRRYAGEPLLDLVRRIIDATGIDVELASSLSPAATARRDNLDLFVKAVAEFEAIDGAVTLPALLAYLTAEDDMGNGLDIATPSEADSVKLLTVHRAKGLEWDTVFVVGVCDKKFPSSQGRTLWVSSPAVLPSRLRGDAADLPHLEGYDKAAIDSYRTASKAHEATEERRLAYVAFTRAAHVMSVSSYLWQDNTWIYGPSDYQIRIRERLEERGIEVTAWMPRPEKGTKNPFAGKDTSAPWPRNERTEEAQRRTVAAELVRSATLEDDDVDMIGAARIARWDEDLERLVTEVRRDRSSDIVVPLPSSLSATAVARLRDDPEAFARDLARPMPRQPSPAARFGTRFHAWVEARFGQQDLFDPDELPGRADLGIDDESELKELTTSFAEGPFGQRAPHAVEPPFALVLAGQVVRGRIDAVYVEPDGTHLVVDWKTSRAATADPLQLALYRLAWSELSGLPIEKVRAAFHYVRSQKTVDHTAELPGREELEGLLTHGPQAEEPTRDDPTRDDPTRDDRGRDDRGRDASP